MKPNLAFVLLAQSTVPTAATVLQAFASLADSNQRIQLGRQESSPDGRTLTFDLEPGGTAIVLLVPKPVPKREADNAARFSVSTLGTNSPLLPHQAQLVVTLRPPAGAQWRPTDQLSAFTTMLAALASTAPSVGIYWGNAGATHPRDFFLATAKEHGVTPRIMLWTGVSVAKETDGRLSLLSLGMRQLDLPDLLLTGPPGRGSETLETFFDLLSYLANRGTALPEGDTVGRTSEERVPIHYVPSPLDASKQVWQVKLP